MKYYAIINGQQIGPVEEYQLKEMGVTKDTLVWREGMPQWQAAGSLPELGYLFIGVPPTPPVPPAMMPKTWLVESILVTLFCCLPLGIVGIVNAAGVSSAYNMGNYNEAMQKSEAAKKWTMWGLIAGLVVGVLYAIFYSLILIGAVGGYY